MNFSPGVVVGTLLTGSVALWAGVPLPPPALEMERDQAVGAWVGEGRGALRPAADPVRYDFGDPTDEEQMYLELVNRSRRNPAAEGERLAGLTDPAIVASYDFFSVNLAAMTNALAAYPPGQPLAFEPRLISAARRHSLWMKTAGIQSHDEVDPQSGAVLNTTAQRINETGYPWQRFGESVFAYAESEEHGHAGFVVDWGPGPGGVQDPPGHRNSNFRPEYREVGIGVLNGPGANNTGPQFVTIEFAARKGPVPLVTGAVYYDLNTNGFYDLGEGVGGISVHVTDATAFAVSAGSGGYVVPSADGVRTVSFSWDGTVLAGNPVVVRGGTNVKSDLILTYHPPVLKGSATPSLGQPSSYSFDAVPGASGYRWRTLNSKAPPTFNADSGLAGVLLNAPGTPLPLVPHGGGKAYHLTHSDNFADQVLELDSWIRPKPGGQIRFAQKLGYAGDAQVASLQMREEEGDWITLWSKAGDGTAGLPNFTTESISLSRYAGSLVRFRFVYSVSAGQYVPLEIAAAGLQVDDIAFPESEEILIGAPQTITDGTSLTFTPNQTTPSELVVRPVRTQGFWPWGPPLVVTPKVGPPPAPVLSGVVLESDGKLRVDFTVAGGLQSVPVLLRAPSLDGAFQAVTGTLSTNAPASYTFRYRPEGAAGFLRVSAP